MCIVQQKCLTANILPNKYGQVVIKTTIKGTNLSVSLTKTNGLIKLGLISKLIYERISHYLTTVKSILNIQTYLDLINRSNLTR